MATGNIFCSLVERFFPPLELKLRHVIIPAGTLVYCDSRKFNIE